MFKHQSRFKKLALCLLTIVMVASSVAESEAAQRRGRSSRRSRSASLMRRYIQARQKAYRKAVQNYQRVMRQRQQAQAQQQARRNAMRRAANQQREEENRQKRESRKNDASGAKNRSESLSAADAHRKLLLKSFDANKDGKLSRQEVARSPLAKKFDKLDTDRDGQLTLDEAHPLPRHKPSTSPQKRPAMREK